MQENFRLSTSLIKLNFLKAGRVLIRTGIRTGLLTQRVNFALTLHRTTNIYIKKDDFRIWKHLNDQTEC